MKELLDKVLDTILNYRTYHNDYYTGNVIEYDNYISFEVYGHSDQGEGSDWTECWSIDNEGRIYTEDTTYENYNEFLKDWY